MSQNYVYSFGGVIGQTDKYSHLFFNQQNVLINKSHFKLFVTSGVPEHYYEVDGDSFLWKGGSKVIQSINHFDYKAEDTKFIYIKKDTNSYAIISDHFSKIPLLYIQKEDGLYFATTLKCLLEISNTKSLDINYDGLSIFYHFGVNSFEQGLIKGLKVLSGGSELNYANGNVVISKYFDITTFETNWRNKDSLDKNTRSIDHILLKSTAKKIQHYDTIGIALSGGVDSGYLAQKITECDRDYNAYTIGYEDGYNEFERIDYLAQILKFKTKKIILSPKDIIDNYLKVSAYSSFPLGFNNALLNFVFESAANDGVELLFDGDGADRLFLGMNKYVQLQKILKLYKDIKGLHMDKVVIGLLSLVNLPSAKKLRFYFQKFNHGIPFYGERILSENVAFDENFELALNDLILPQELKTFDKKADQWLFFSLFSLYYTPTFFFHSPYELQLKHGLVSNAQFWSDDMAKLALSIPTAQKLYQKTTKRVLREAAKQKIDNGYWSLPKIGLQNSYKHIKTKALGKDFIKSYVELIKNTEEYLYLVEHTPKTKIDPERLIRYYIWKENLF